MFVLPGAERRRGRSALKVGSAGLQMNKVTPYGGEGVFYWVTCVFSISIVAAVIGSFFKADFLFFIKGVHQHIPNEKVITIVTIELFMMRIMIGNRVLPVEEPVAAHFLRHQFVTAMAGNIRQLVIPMKSQKYNRMNRDDED